MTAILSTFQSMDRRARTGIAVGAGLIVLLTALALWWLLAPTQRLLFGNPPQAEAAEIAKALEEWKVPHSFTEDGAGILVDGAQLHSVRMRLVSAGIPTGGHVGYELFNDNEFGVTEFAQRINYQRALQGELERTIAALPGVQNVRVHLSMRRGSLFLADEAQSKASVAIALQPGSQLDRRQVNGIRNLVASAVEGLEPSAVVVVGPSGLQLSPAAGGDGALLSEEQVDAGRAMAGALETRLQQLLDQALPGQRSAVSVDVRLNFDHVKRTREQLLAQPGSANGLVVKRSSNGAPAAAPGMAAQLLNEQVEYAHGSEREEVTQAAGRIERVSVAVMLPASVPATEQERLQRLISAAAGIDAARGDSLEIAVAPRLPAARPAANPVSPSTVRHDGVAVATVGGWRFGWPLAVCVLVAALLGALAGAWATRRRQTAPRLLTAAESEAAARKVRAWLTEGAA